MKHKRTQWWGTLPLVGNCWGAFGALLSFARSYISVMRIQDSPVSSGNDALVSVFFSILNFSSFNDRDAITFPFSFSSSFSNDFVAVFPTVAVVLFVLWLPLPRSSDPSWPYLSFWLLCEPNVLALVTFTTKFLVKTGTNDNALLWKPQTKSSVNSFARIAVTGEDDQPGQDLPTLSRVGTREKIVERADACSDLLYSRPLVPS